MQKELVLMAFSKLPTISANILRQNSFHKSVKLLLASSDFLLSEVKKDLLIPPEIQEAMLLNSTLNKVIGIWLEIILQYFSLEIQLNSLILYIPKREIQEVICHMESQLGISGVYHLKVPIKSQS